jgi:hypothetical protein
MAFSIRNLARFMGLDKVDLFLIRAYANIERIMEFRRKAPGNVMVGNLS